VAELVARHDLSAERARRFPLRNVLSRAVGTHETVEPDVQIVPLRPGDCLLLATDGLTGALEAAEIEEIMARQQGQTPETVCRAIVQAALEHQPEDNVTVVAVRVTA
jgi:PPM family protein phosphatase